jgi:RNAse (barnase) inhibitor barstar
MAYRITISFKEGTQEEDLYNHVKKQFGFSSYIKDLIKKDMDKKETKKEENFSLINF